jgi:glycosyltransferase involved in cell wall biosynthesis
MAHLNHEYINKAQPLLSICIPTFNRAYILEKTLHSIVSQKIFEDTNEIEVIVSDNCSNDNTFEIVNKYIKKFDNKIFYYKNEINITDLNFEKVLSLGKGEYLKLNNDTLIHTKESLNDILNLIKLNITEKPQLFFTSGWLNSKENISGNGIDTFIFNASFLTTWIGAFGIWKSDFLTINNFSERRDLQLVQTDILFKLINKKNAYIIDNKKYFYTIESKNKGGYNFLQVFLLNYTFLLKEQLAANKLQHKTYHLETKRILLRQIAHWIAKTKIQNTKYTFIMENTFSIIFKFFKKRPLLLIIFLIKYNLYLMYFFIKKSILKIDI